jgi:uncharacterized protein YdbL (DUF1318 family)
MNLLKGIDIGELDLGTKITNQGSEIVVKIMSFNGLNLPEPISVEDFNDICGVVGEQIDGFLTEIAEAKERALVTLSSLDEKYGMPISQLVAADLTKLAAQKYATINDTRVWLVGPESIEVVLSEDDDGKDLVKSIDGARVIKNSHVKVKRDGKTMWIHKDKINGD